MTAKNVARQQGLSAGISGHGALLVVLIDTLGHELLRKIEGRLINDLQLVEYLRLRFPAAEDSLVGDIVQHMSHGSFVPVFAGAGFDALLIEKVRNFEPSITGAHLNQLTM